MAGDRDKLVEQHLSLVQAIAAKLKRNLGRTMDYDDLVAYGSKGLIEAAARFDSTQGASFTTFAYYRIRGAMLDGLRTMGWYSRADYARYRAEERAHEYLQNQSDREGAPKDAGGKPEESDPAKTLESIAETLGGIATVHITCLEAASTLADERVAPADAILESTQMGLRARAALQVLPEKEKRLMELYYFADKTLEEAGAELGLSKSWACRLHARAINLMRASIGED